MPGLFIIKTIAVHLTPAVLWSNFHIGYTKVPLFLKIFGGIMATKAVAIPATSHTFEYPLIMGEIDEIRVVFPLRDFPKRRLPKWLPKYKSQSSGSKSGTRGYGVGKCLSLIELIDSLRDRGFLLKDAYIKRGRGGLLVVVFSRYASEICRRRGQDLKWSCFARFVYDVTMFPNAERLGSAGPNILLKCQFVPKPRRFRPMRLIFGEDGFALSSYEAE